MGRDKALIALGGSALLARAAERLRPDCRWVGASVRAPGAAADLAVDLTLAVIEDPAGLAQGPLAGILGGLRWAKGLGAEAMMAAPCDAPFLPEDLSRRLIAGLTDRACAMARTPDGLQPLCSAWRVEMIAVLEAALTDGRHPPAHALLADAGCALVDYPGSEAFLNINGPEDLSEAERRLAAAPRA